MALLFVGGSPLIFVFGSARSGSTWLGKIFDSHPDTLYLHEPDIVDRGSDLVPFWFDRALTVHDIDSARAYLARLAALRDVRTIGIRPFFRKSYRGPIEEGLHRSFIYGTKFLERAGLGRFANDIAIPDLAFRGPPVQTVIKSVSSLGRAQAFLAAAPLMKPVLLVRHPCGYVDSMLRGERIGVMPRPPGLGRLAITASAARLGFDADRLRNMDAVTLLSWTWLLSNLEAYSAVEQANGVILVYEELAANPVDLVKDLFTRLELRWPKETAEFLARSQETQGDYYSVFRDPREGIERWKGELGQDTIEKIRAIVCRDTLGARFFTGR